MHFRNQSQLSLEILLQHNGAWKSEIITIT